MGFTEWMQGLHPHKIFFLAAQFKNWTADYILEHKTTPKGADGETLEWWEWCWQVPYKAVCRRKGWEYGAFEPAPEVPIEDLLDEDWDIPKR